MSWGYNSRTGAVRTSNGGHWTAADIGWSGRGEGLNNPLQEHVHGVGPIPRGNWRMTELILADPHTGLFTIVLTPCEGTQVFGRDGFRIHGANEGNPKESSHGCIVLPRWWRERIWFSGDRDLEVV